MKSRRLAEHPRAVVADVDHVGVRVERIDGLKQLAEHGVERVGHRPHERLGGAGADVCRTECAVAGDHLVAGRFVQRVDIRHDIGSVAALP